MGKYLLIKNGNVITSAKTFKSDILIEEGKIIDLSQKIEVSGREVKIIDAEPFQIFPGGIDPHVHMNLPFGGTFSSDNFETGSIAALAGGTTTIIDFVTPGRNESLIENLYARKENAKTSICDYGFHMSLTSFNNNSEIEIRKCVENEGVSSFKVYLAYKNSIGIDDNELISLMEIIKKTNALMTLHCEYDESISYLRKRYIREGKTEPIYHARTRPPENEGIAVKKVIMLSEIIGIPIYIVHLSSSNGLIEIQKAAGRKYPVFAETCPQYLLLDESKYLNDFNESAKFIMSPPLREHMHQDVLWNGIKQGSIQTLGTDHCPFNFKGQKDLGKNDFSKIPNGAGGVQHRLELLYTFGVESGKINLNKFVELTSANAAKIFGLYPQKGEIAIGSDADLILWNPKSEKTISSKSHFQNCDSNIYEGFKIKGCAEVVISNGEIVFESGKIVLGKNRGRFLFRKNKIMI